ncbi:MAG: DUF4032 domain-containing protein [Chloroflexi bacterium]|jgi:hypothetical protein|nr:DUF4032 domain-containing protein [Chloroflexota bacterium]
MSVALTMQDNLDFRRARSKCLLRRAWGVLSGHRTDLLPWEEVRDKLKLRGLIRRGIQTVPIEKIKGSVGRYKDFDDAFLPTNDGVSSRWRKINRAFYEDIHLPPISLYKVGDAYFVLDGNHRVSVAREHGIKFIDAEVQEATTPVPVTADDIDAESLTLLGEYADFLERTRLHLLRPGQNIRFSIGGGYARLLEHIAVHRYFMGLERRREVSEDEAVADWYDNLYMPIVEAIRKTGALSDFPGRTEADLYLWIMDHRHFLKEQYGRDVSPEQATADYARQYAQKSRLHSAQQAFRHMADRLRTFLTYKPRSMLARAAAH